MTVLAIDTETTGLSLYHGSEPFIVTGCDSEGNQWWHEWDVDPYTRKVHIPENAAQEIAEEIDRCGEVVFHNASFDLQALYLIGKDHNLFGPDWWRNRGFKLHDTQIAAHVVKSDSPLSLKDLAQIHLGISKDDQHKLQQSTIAARRHRIVKDLEWTIANPGIPQQAGYEKGFVFWDYWLPSAVRKAWDKGWKRNSDRYIGTTEPPQSWRSHTKNGKFVPSECLYYGLKDVERTIQLHLLLQEIIREEKLTRPYRRETNLILETWELIRNGVHLHKKRLYSEFDRSLTVCEESERVIVAASKRQNFNIRSPEQMKSLLYKKPSEGGWGLPVLSLTKTGQPSTDAKTLLQLRKTVADDTDAAHFLDALDAYRKADKARSYLKSYRSFGIPDKALHGSPGLRLHPGYRQNGTKTTRYSCSEPNTTNISKGKEIEVSNEYGEHETAVDYRLRYNFGPGKHRIWFAKDYTQLQLRIFAHVSGSTVLSKAFEDGWDFHNFVASKLYNTPEPSSLQRRVAKNINFGLIFGAGERKIDATAGVPGAYKMFADQFPDVHDYMQRVISQVKRQGYVTTPFGYRLYVPKDRAYAGVCYIVQGCEGDLVKNAIIKCAAYLRRVSRTPELLPAQYSKTPFAFITLLVHDELITDFPLWSDDSEVIWKEHVQALKEYMEAPGREIGLNTPVEVSVIRRCWSDPAKPLWETPHAVS